MSNAKTLHLQFAGGEIEVGTLIDALYKQERTIVICMEAAEGTRKALEAENARFQSAIVGMIDLAHEYRHLLTQQRFPDNDEGDAFRRHREAQVLRIERILSAAQAAKVESHE